MIQLSANSETGKVVLHIYQLLVRKRLPRAPRSSREDHPFHCWQAGEACWEERHPSLVYAGYPTTRVYMSPSLPVGVPEPFLAGWCPHVRTGEHELSRMNNTFSSVVEGERHKRAGKTPSSPQE